MPFVEKDGIQIPQRAFIAHRLNYPVCSIYWDRHLGFFIEIIIIIFIENVILIRLFWLWTADILTFPYMVMCPVVMVILDFWLTKTISVNTFEHYPVRSYAKTTSYVGSHFRFLWTWKLQFLSVHHIKLYDGSF